MVERALSREDMIANREIDSVAEEFSLRGFTMPTGMQAARTDQMRQGLGAQEAGTLNRELTIKLPRADREHPPGVQQAIAAENVFVNIFLNLRSACSRLPSSRSEVAAQHLQRNRSRSSTPG